MTVRYFVAGTAGVLATLALAMPALAENPTTSPMLELFGSGRVPSEAATSTMRRGGGFVDVEVMTDGLDPATAYTVWLVVYNHPEFCQGGPGACGVADLPVIPGHDPRVRASGVYVTGGYSGEDGSGHFVGRVHVAKDGIKPTETLFGPGLRRPFSAQYDVVVRGHGQPANPFNAVQSYESGCAETMACGDHQISLHPPANLP